MIRINASLCLIGAISAIIIGDNDYKKNHEIVSLVLCCFGIGMLAFTCMVVTISIFLK